MVADKAGDSAAGAVGGVDDAVEVVAPTDAASIFDGPRRTKTKRRTVAAAAGNGEVAAMKAITKGRVDASLAKKVLDYAAQYELILISLMAEN